MSASNNFETSLLTLIFNNTDITGVARGAASAGNFYLSLHTASPGEAGQQNTSEATYTSYARVQVDRNSGDWTITSDECSNASVISFPLATGGSEIITHWGLGLDSTGTGTLLLYGELSASLAVSNGVRPLFDVGDLIISLD